jgi:uncharacterized protein YciU (UPF0263 family)
MSITIDENNKCFTLLSHDRILNYIHPDVYVNKQNNLYNVISVGTFGKNSKYSFIPIKTKDKKIKPVTNVKIIYKNNFIFIETASVELTSNAIILMQIPYGENGTNYLIDVCGNPLNHHKYNIDILAQGIISNFKGKQGEGSQYIIRIPSSTVFGYRKISENKIENYLYYYDGQWLKKYEHGLAND